MKLIIKDDLSSAERRHLMFWRDRVFPEEGVGYQWTEPTWHLFVYERDGPAKDRPVAHLGFDRFRLDAGEESIEVIGVGGLVVRPECQGRRIPATIFAHLHERVPQYFSLDRFALFCPERLVAYYRRHGYSHYDGDVWIEQRQGRMKTDFQFMYRGFDLTDAKLEIPSLPW